MAGWTRGVGQYAAGEVHVVWTARLHRPSVPVVPVIFIHGATANADQFLPLDWSDAPKMLADRGFVVASIDAGGEDTWGNQDVQDAVDDALVWLASEFGARTDRVAFYGASAGAPGALNWAAAQPDRVAGVAAVLPVVDVDSLHSEGGSLATSIEAAWGTGATYDANQLLYDPAERHSDYQPFAGRLRAFYSDDDPIIPPGEVEAFADSVGCTAESLGELGHSIVGAEHQRLVDWLTVTIRNNDD